MGSIPLRLPKDVGSNSAVTAVGVGGAAPADRRTQEDSVGEQVAVVRGRKRRRTNTRWHLRHGAADALNVPEPPASEQTDVASNPERRFDVQLRGGREFARPVVAVSDERISRSREIAANVEDVAERA